MTRLTIKQTGVLIEYFQDKLEADKRKYIDVTEVREEVETILNESNISQTVAT